MEVGHNHFTESRRPGATARPDPNGSEESSESSLPMIVHLRGDEPIVEDFSYDADAAMEFLQIKRSRLTQISGRELRVGKIRVDRYIRPVYRLADLQSYRNWTRPTASHSRSKEAITSAIGILEERAQNLEEQFSSFQEAMSADLEAKLESHRTAIMNQVSLQLDLLGGALRKFGRTGNITIELEAIRRRLTAYKVDLQAGLIGMEKLAGSQERELIALKGDVADLGHLGRTDTKKLDQLGVQIQKIKDQERAILQHLLNTQEMLTDMETRLEYKSDRASTERTKTMASKALKRRRNHKRLPMSMRRSY